jgi:predicted lipoprotein with Yx(FWY)xxD motif
MRQMNHRKPGEGQLVGHGAITRMVVVLTLTAMLGVIGFLAAGSVAQSAVGANATVTLRKTQLGMILVNSRGHTLYLFAKDRNGKSACSGTCAKFWPPSLHSGKPTAGSGVKASILGTTKRSNGSLQLTYNKHPLYTFTLDKRAGQTNGEGNLAFGARWYAVSAKGTAVVRASTTPTTTTTTTTSCRYPPCP